MSMKCDRCGEVFNPEPPDEMGRHKPNAVILVDRTYMTHGTTGVAIAMTNRFFAPLAWQS